MNGNFSYRSGFLFQRNQNRSIGDKMNTPVKCAIVLMAFFLVALAPATATTVLYAGNAGYTIYPTLVNDTNTTFVDMYNSAWTGPSDDLLQLAWDTVNNSSTQTGGFYQYDIVFYDMGEFWYYPFGNKYQNGTPAGTGAYDLASASGTKFIALRSADYMTGSHLTDYPFAVIDDSNWTQSGMYYANVNNTKKAYLLNFFNQNFYNSTNPYFVGNATQANAFVAYVNGI